MRIIRHIAMTIALVLGWHIGHSQNLVPNPSFELSDSCPILGATPFDNISHCQDWFQTQYTYSVDFYHPCMPSQPYNFQPPNTYSGYSDAKHGEGFAGLIPFSFDSQSREVLSVELNQPMQKDSAYCVSFFYKNSMLDGADYAIDNLGILFTQDTITLADKTSTPPHCRTIADQPIYYSDWGQYEGYYIASGGESFLNLGTFGPSSLTTGYHDYSFPTGYNVTYYFVDSVVVQLCSRDSVLQVLIDFPNVFTPNGDGINDVLNLDSRNVAELHISIINRWGDLIQEFDGITSAWDGKNRGGKEVTAGTYFLIATGVDIFGWQVRKKGFIQVVK